jgi:hypothetical protein
VVVCAPIESLSPDTYFLIIILYAAIDSSKVCTWKQDAKGLHNCRHTDNHDPMVHLLAVSGPLSIRHMPLDDGVSILPSAPTTQAHEPT